MNPAHPRSSSCPLVGVRAARLGHSLATPEVPTAGSSQALPEVCPGAETGAPLAASLATVTWLIDVHAAALPVHAWCAPHLDSIYGRLGEKHPASKKASSSHADLQRLPCS